jgi:hypothetical protein
VLTLIDMPGAANGAAAERAGQGPAITAAFHGIAAARTPITTLVIARAAPVARSRCARRAGPGSRRTPTSP